MASVPRLQGMRPTDYIDSPARSIVLGLQFDAWSAGERQATLERLLLAEAAEIAPGAEMVVAMLLNQKAPPVERPWWEGPEEPSAQP